MIKFVLLLLCVFHHVEGLTSRNRASPVCNIPNCSECSVDNICAKCKEPNQLSSNQCKPPAECKDDNELVKSWFDGSDYKINDCGDLFGLLVDNFMDCESDLSILTVFGMAVVAIEGGTTGNKVCCNACKVGTKKPSPAPTVGQESVLPTEYQGEKCLVKEFVEYMKKEYGYDCTGDRCYDDYVM